MGVVAHGAPVFRIGGDPGGISTRAAVMMDRANEFADIHAGLSSLTSDGWQGRAADHFRYKFNLQIKGWLDAQIAFSDASTAYQSYASTLLSAQSQCDEIRSRWEQGRNAVEQAQNNKANARSQAAAEGGTPAFDASCDEGPGRSTMAAAEADFQSLVNQVNESGTLLINALNSGISKLPERTWMDSVARTFKSVYDGFVEATIDLVKLVWFIGGQAALYDIGRVICGYMTPEELVTKWVELPVETVAGLFKVLSEKPGAFFEGLAKGIFDYDTFIDDPGRWVGHALPDILITIATAGAGGGASAGSKAATGASRASRIGRALFKELTHIADLEDIANLSKLAFNKLKKVGIDAVTNLSTIAENAAERLRRLKEAGHTGHPPLFSSTDNTPSVPSSGAPSSPSHGGPSSPSYSPPNYPGYNSGGTPNLSGTPAPSHGNGGYSGNASHGGAGAADPNSRFAPPGQQSNGMSAAAHSGDAGTTDPTSKYAPPTHQHNGTPGAAQPGTTPQASGGAGNASHTSHGGADVKDSALPPTDPGHRSNGVSSAAQPATTPHAPAAGDASGHTVPAAPAPSASHGAHDNAFMNADTGGATHGAGNAAAPGTSGHTGAPASGAHGAPATGAPATGTHGAPATGTHGAPATGAPATGIPAAGTHGAPATGAPATGTPSAGSHGGASGHGAAGGSPAAPLRNNGVGERGAPSEAIAQKKPADPDKIFTRSGTDFGTPANKIDTHAGGNQKSLDHVDVKPGDSDKVPNDQYHPVETAGGARRGGTDGALTGDNFAPQPAAAGNGKPPQLPDFSSEKMREHFSEKINDLHSSDPGANDLLRSRRDEPTFTVNSDPVYANGQKRGVDELVGAGVGRSEASVGAQGSYERAGAFGGSDPSRVSYRADGFGSTADFGANAGHAGHGANSITNSADVGGGVGDASRSTHAAGAPTGQGGGHVGADAGHGPHRADPSMSTGDTHGASRADSTPGHGDTPRAGQGGDGRPGAPSSHDAPDAPTIPKKETPAGDALGGDKQPHGGKPAADTPTTHADDAADTSKAGHGSGDANGAGKADADAQHGHDSVEHADADPKAKDHSANGKADDTADSTRHGDKTEADKPTSDKSHKEDDAAHHDGDEHPKDTNDKHTTKNDDADTKTTKDEADTHKSDKDADGKSPKDDADTHKSDKDGDGKSPKDDADTHKSDKDGDGKSDKDDADTHKSDKDGDGKSDKDDADTHKSDKDDADGKSDKDDADTHKSDKDDADTHKSDKDEKYEDLYDHSHDKDGPDSSYNPETDPHSNPDPNYDSLPDPSIDQSEGFPEGVDPYRTPPKTRRQLEEALEAWDSYQKKVLPDDANKWHSGRYGFDDVVNPERALGYNPDGSPRSMEDFMKVYYDKEKKQPIWPWDVEGLRKNGAKLNANYHEYTSITPFIETHGEDLCRLGDPGGKYAAAMHEDGTPPSFGERSLFPPYSLGDPDMRVRLTGKLPEGHVVKYGEVAPAFGQPGGAIQLQIWGPDGTTGKMKELTLDEWKDREIIEYYEDN